MKLSIKVKMSLLVGIIILALIGALLAATLLFAEPFMIHRQKQALEGLYHTLEKNYSDEETHLAKIVAPYEKERSAQVEIFDSKGALIYTSGRKMTEGFGGFQGNLPQRPEGDRKHPGGSLSSYSEDPAVQRLRQGEEELLILKGIIQTEEGLRYISVESPVEAIYATVEVLDRLILMIAAAVALLGCGAAYLYASRFSKPIAAVSETAKRVAALDFSHHAEENGSTEEIADLAISINAMSRQLEGFIGELVEQNRRLEEDNERLAKAEESRRAFVANVSHDLKSPLAVLGGYAEMLKEHTAGVDPETCYDVIMEETVVMNEMIRSMLDVSALENGIKNLEKSPLSLSDWLAELMEREQPLLEKKGFFVETAITPALTAEVDEEYLERAVLNILRNAESHTPPKGRISIALAKGKDGLFLSVYNDGNSIPEDRLHKIWDSFYKADEARTRDGSANVGLGLYIVKTIVIAHGGSCGAVNEQKGVRFWIRLDEKTSAQ